MNLSYSIIYDFEQAIGRITGAPYVIMTDRCTHAIELCLLYDKVKKTSFTPFTYLSVPMTMVKLGIEYSYNNDDMWAGEYQFEGTRIWDSARKLQAGMYRPGQMQCLSFGITKPLEIGHGGAILLDDYQAYNTIIKQRSDGRDLSISPWQDQQVFELGFHYCPSIEDAVKGLELIPKIDQTIKYKQYPDLRKIIIK
jgi:dTDP-4-amino-4,6-dideoxygalactose transaminase